MKAMKRSTIAGAVAACAIIVNVHAAASAWGLKGHTLVGQAAMARLPADLPAFLRTDDAKNEIVYLQDEEDRLKIGEDLDRAWAREWTTDHYLDIGDDGTVGGLPAASLPETRDDYIKALWTSAKPVDAYAVGFLPYAIVEGYEQVRADFALWRQAPPAERAQRAGLAVHDIGIFAHFVGDGSQPLHVSVHYNGWGDYPNPQDFSESRTFHADYEGKFVDENATLASVTALVGPAQVFPDVPLAAVSRYLLDSNAQVVPLYKMAKAGAMDPSASPQAKAKLVAFTSARLAAAATMLDSLIETAWRSSASLTD